MSRDLYTEYQELFATVLRELSNGADLEWTWASPEPLPPFVFRAQLHWQDDEHPVAAERWTLGDVEFLPVYQTGMNAPLAFPGDYGYAGVLARMRGTQAWHDFFRVPIQYKAYKTENGEQLFLTDKNVIGAFVKDKRFMIDVSDNDGAGSGEGTMTRFVLGENGWSYGGCFYFGGTFDGKSQSNGLLYDPSGQEPKPRAECLL
jgi:hypothetical protein